MFVQILKKNMKFFVTLILMGSSLSLFAQHKIKLGSQIPIQYALQYDYQIHKKWSLNGQVGVLTKPYDEVILEVMRSFGVDQEIVNVLSNAFQLGIVTQGGVNYHFGKNYVGALGSWIHLKAADTPVSAVEAAFNVSVASYPTRPRQSNLNPVSLTLASDLYNVGILYDRRFTFANPKIELHTEFSFAKTIASSSYVESPQRALESLSTMVDAELKTTYLDYGFLPSINVFFVYKFGRN